MRPGRADTRAERLTAGQQWRGDDAVASLRRRRAEAVLRPRRRGVVVGDGPGATEAVDAAQPEARVSAIELTRDGGEDAGHDRADRIAGREGRGDLGDGRQRARNRPGRPSEWWSGERYLGHDVWRLQRRRDKMTDSISKTRRCRVRNASARYRPPRPTAIDRGEEFGVRPAVARVVLDVRPADHPVGSDQEVRALGVEAVLEHHAVQTRDVPPEVAQQVDLHVVLCLVLLERVRMVDADREHRHAAPGELVVVVAHLAQLGRAGARERQRKEGEQHGFAAKRRKRELFARRRRQREVRRDCRPTAGTV